MISNTLRRLLAGLLVLPLGCGTSAEPLVTAQEPAASSQSTTNPSATHPERSRPTNRLAKETSPYLLLHAHNPVDWYPWGSEALDKAKRENKVIFLSVGYSSCHWCHVMERESFMDDEIAAFLNRNFVCIKVDREERPDVDEIYMKAVQIYGRVTGAGERGGWPMSTFLTPDARPFFGGTYFPARDGDRGMAMGFLTLIQRVQELWTTRPDDLKRDASNLTDLVKADLDATRIAATEAPSSETSQNAFRALEQRFDPKFGGFGYSESNPRYPKFPEPSNLLFLLSRQQSAEVTAKEKERGLAMLIQTLEQMAMGGIRDHLGGGFHRYSVDRYWHIPHFEKMLYDNGQLATVYTEAYRLTGREDFRRVVEELLDFVRREMTDESGGFYSALDAESEDEEGKFYRWDKEEVERALTAEEYALFADVYGLDDEPNFEEEYYAVQLDRTFADVAAAHELSDAELEARLKPLRDKLLAIRDTRPRPLTDTKILTSWNGLMIRGFADAGAEFDNQEYLATAATAADFVLAELRDPNGRLLRTYGNGTAKLNAYLDDYAFLVDGLIALYKATNEKRWLEEADALTAKQLELFWDEEHGGFYFTSGDHESLIARGRDPVDGAEPSGNSVAADNLVFLASELGKQEYRDKADRAFKSVAGLLSVAPAAAPRMAIALDRWLQGEAQVQQDP